MRFLVSAARLGRFGCCTRVALTAAASVALITSCSDASEQAGDPVDASQRPTEVPVPYDPSDPMASIISPDDMRGLDANLRIVDADELAASLREAGLAEAQVSALQENDLSLDRYAQLVQLEIACLRDQGIEAGQPEISTVEYGIQLPTYGYPAAVPGLSEDDISRIQVECQNRFTGAYQGIYVAANMPSEEERLDRDIDAANRFLACAVSKGAEPPLTTVRNAAEFEDFYAWFTSPSADIACTFNP